MQGEAARSRQVSATKHLDLEAPPVDAVCCVGWQRSNPNRVGRTEARLWFDAREAIMRELGVSDISSLEVVKVES